MWDMMRVLLKRRAIAGLGQHAGVQVLSQSNGATPWLPQQPTPAMMPTTYMVHRVAMSTATKLHLSDVLLCCCGIGAKESQGDSKAQM